MFLAFLPTVDDDNCWRVSPVKGEALVVDGRDLIPDAAHLLRFLNETAAMPELGLPVVREGEDAFDVDGRTHRCRTAGGTGREQERRRECVYRPFKRLAASIFVSR